MSEAISRKNLATNEMHENEHVDEFVREIIYVCRKYRLSFTAENTFLPCIVRRVCEGDLHAIETAQDDTCHPLKKKRKRLKERS